MSNVIHVQFGKAPVAQDALACSVCKASLPTFDGTTFALPTHDGVTLLAIVFRVRCNACGTEWDMRKNCG